MQAADQEAALDAPAAAITVAAMAAAGRAAARWAVMMTTLAAAVALVEAAAVQAAVPVVLEVEAGAAPSLASLMMTRMEDWMAPTAERAAGPAGHPHPSLISLMELTLTVLAGTLEILETGMMPQGRDPEAAADLVQEEMASMMMTVPLEKETQDARDPETAVVHPMVAAADLDPGLTFMAVAAPQQMMTLTALITLMVTAGGHLDLAEMGTGMVVPSHQAAGRGQDLEVMAEVMGMTVLIPMAQAGKAQGQRLVLRITGGCRGQDLSGFS